MHHSKLLELLRTFSAARWRRFGEFLQSPYWNKNTEVVAFFQLLAPFHPAFSQPQLEKPAVLHALSADKPADEKTLAYLMSQLLALAESFLATEALRDDATLADVLLLNQLRASGLTRHFASSLEKARKKRTAASGADVTFLQREFELAQLEYETLTDSKQLQFNPLLQNAAERLDTFYLACKLRLLCAMSNMERLLAVEYGTFLAAELEEKLADPARLTDPAAAAWWNAWQLTRYDKVDHFNRLLELLREHGDAWPPPEQKQLYFYALNFCTRRINHYNDHGFYEKYLEINDLLLQKGLLLDNGELLPRNFLNLLYAGLRSNKLDWTWEFLHQWRRCLPRASAENLFAYGLAQWHYFQRDYNRAQTTLARVEFEDFLIALGARSLQVKIYYETDQTELLFSALEANRLFLLRAKQIEPRLRRQMQQFMDFTRRLAKIYPPDPAKLRALAERLPPAAEVMHRDWLAGMIEKRIGK